MFYFTNFHCKFYFNISLKLFLFEIGKYQHVYQRDGEQKVQSLYIAFRTISENGKDWMHPGFQGLKAFAETEAWVETELKRIMENL